MRVSHHVGCKYHVVFIPKVPQEGVVRKYAQACGEVFRKLAEQKESRIGGRGSVGRPRHMMIRYHRAV